MNAPVWVDTTLRDGLQTPGLHPDYTLRFRLFELLDSLGLPVLEVGIPVRGPEERRFIDRCVSVARGEVVAWCRLREEDLTAALETSAPVLHFAVPAGSGYEPLRGARTSAEVLKQAEGLVKQAAAAGRLVSLGAEDAPHAEPSFLAELFRVAGESGAVRVRYADSLGCLTPSQILKTFPALVDLSPVHLEFHGHNDLGLATANALCAWECGAQALSVTLGGLGERGGHTPLEEVAAAVESVWGLSSGLKKPELVAAVNQAWSLLGLSLPAHKPVSGSWVFRHEAGIHADLVARGGRVTVLDPEDWGQHHELPLSSQSGRRHLILMAHRRGFSLDEEASRRLMHRWVSYWSSPGSKEPPETVFDLLLEDFHA